LNPAGFGGVSVVYEAIDTVDGRRIALKLPAPHFAADPLARSRVHREAMITDWLRNPSVPRIYGYGDARLPDGGTVPYVSMELLHGVVLAGRLARGPLPWREAVTVGATVADVLAIAHRRGVVHRDLAPDNIVVTASGAKIVDFGEATTVETDWPAGSGRPRPAHRVSSGGQPSDDVYALGVLLYQMLTGHSPYHGVGWRIDVQDSRPDGYQIDLSASRRHQTAPTPVLLVPGLPRQVAEICRSCMAKRPQDRPSSRRAALTLWELVLPDRGATTDWRSAAVPAPALPAAPVPAVAALSGPYSSASC
jgi:serine/threonine protein kinase